METIYSKIIWGELGLKDYKIHLEESEKTRNLILGWVRDTDISKVEEVLFDLSWIKKTTYETYYDGPFYGFSQHEDQVLDKLEGHKCDLLIHDSGMFTTILEMAIRTRMNPSEFILMSQILEEFWKKVPVNESCSSDGHNWGYKVEDVEDKE
jgi:hypothetical protein